MKTNRSIDEVVASLEAQAAYHREREAYHSAQKAAHEKEQAAHAAELGDITGRLEAFRAAIGGALDLSARSVPQAPAGNAEEDDLGSASRPRLKRMVELILDSPQAGERFGSVGLAQEVNLRFRDRLRKPVTSSQVSVVLRRLAEGKGKRIKLVRAGRPHQEALYVRL